MIRATKKLLTQLALCILFPLLSACSGGSADASAAPASSGEVAASTSADVQENNNQKKSDLIARVGNQGITYSQLNTMMNSSAMVGLSIPALGTPERYRAIITLLDKVISANLIYLDAKASGTDKLPEYLNDVQRFEDATIASLYKSKVMFGEIPVTDEEINAFYETSIGPDVELTEDIKLAIEAELRKQKLEKLKATMSERLRDGVRIEIDETLLKAVNTDERKDGDVIVRVDDAPITWGDIKVAMRGADQKEVLDEFNYDSDEERLKRLQSLIDEYLLVTKGRAASMQNDPVFMKRAGEFRKTRLINMHRERLSKNWRPTDELLQAYFEEHRDNISVPEARKVQMVVVETEAEAEAIKARINSGEITMYQAAQKYSIDPNAKETLGEIGWVNRGSGFPELDEFTFLLEPEELGGPIESPAGWHLVKVLDVRDAQLQYLSEPQTRKTTMRMYMKEQQANYVVSLRQNKFDVEVYDANLTRLFQEEADWIAALNKKSKQEGSLTQERIKDMQKWLKK